MSDGSTLPLHEQQELALLRAYNAAAKTFWFESSPASHDRLIAAEKALNAHYVKHPRPVGG